MPVNNTSPVGCADRKEAHQSSSSLKAGNKRNDGISACLYSRRFPIFLRSILPNASAIGYQSRKSIYFVAHLNTQNSVTLFRELGEIMKVMTSGGLE